MLKKTSAFLAALLVVCLLAGTTQAQEKCNWATGDDIVVVHYPAVIANAKIVRDTAESPEWKDFLTNAKEKIKTSLPENLAKAEFPDKMESWVKEQISSFVDSDSDATTGFLGEAASQTRAIVLALNFNPESANDKVIGTLTVVLNIDPADNTEVRQFVTDRLPHEVVRNENGITLLKITTPKGDVWVAKTKLGTSTKTVVIMGQDQESVSAKANEYSQSNELADAVANNKNVLRSVYVNPRFIKKFMPKLDGITATAKEKAGDLAKDQFYKSMPDWFKTLNIPELGKNICRKFDSVVYTIEENEDTGIGLTFQANAATEEDAQQLNDVIVGTLALIRIQIDQKGENASEPEKKTCQFLKNTQFKHEGKSIYVKVDLTAGMVTDFLKKSLKQAVEAKLATDNI